MLFYNAGIFTACSGFIKNGYVLIKDGRIIDVGPMDFCPKDDEKYDLSGLTIYPGFIDAHCHLGMWEEGLSFEGDDGNDRADRVIARRSREDNARGSVCVNVRVTGYICSLGSCTDGAYLGLNEHSFPEDLAYLGIDKLRLIYLGKNYLLDFHFSALFS